MYKHTILLFVLFSTFHLPLFADQVELQNGDRLSGTLKSYSNGKLTFILKGAASGTVTLLWKDVKSITTNQTFSIMLKNKTPLIAKLLSGSPSSMTIQKINVKPQETISIKDIDTMMPYPPPEPKSPKKKKKEKSEWKGDVSFSLRLTKGPKESESLYSSLYGHIIKRSETDRFTFTANHNVVQTTTSSANQDVTSTSRDTLGSIKYDYFITPAVYPYAHYIQENHGGKRIQLRTTRGIGMGYNILESDDTRLFTEAGISEIITEYKSNTLKDGFELGNVRETSNRLSLGGSQNFFSFMKLDLTADMFMNQDFKSTHYSRTQAKTSFIITKKWSLFIQASVRYDQVVPDNTQRDETVYNTGLTYRF